MPRRYIYLIRNATHAPDASVLNAQGHEQALRTMQALRHLPLTALWCSPVTYAMETAAILAQGFEALQPRPSSLLGQYQTVDLMDERFSDLLLDEASQQSVMQLDAAEAQFFGPVEADEQIIIVCHATLIRDLICRALSVNPQSWAHMLIHHCGISCLSLDESGGAELMVYDDIRHLPDALHST